MKSTLGFLLSMVGACCLTAVSTLSAGELTKVFYPNQEEAAFTLLVPSDWNMIPQGEEGAEDYFEVEGPNLYLSFRIVPDGDLETAIEEHVEYLQEEYTDVEMAEPEEKEINGMEAFLLPAAGKDEDGELRELGSGWFLLDEESELIGELWYDVPADDDDAIAAAVAVLNSLQLAE